MSESAKLDRFIGTDVKTTMVNWLNDTFEKKEGTKNYCILFGPSGNGKTFLVQLLADAYGAELMSFCSTSICGMEDVNNIIKSMNLSSMSHKRKIIVFDGVDEFHKIYRAKLIDVPSIYPVIYTCINVEKIPLEIRRKFMMVEVNKPITFKLFDHLKTLSKLPEETLFKIAKESKSVRSAELSTMTGSVNTLVTREKSIYDVIRDISNRELDVELTRKNINAVMDSVQGYGENELQVMEQLAEFDYLIRCKNMKIDPFIVNNLNWPIEKVELVYRDEERKKKLNKSVGK